MAETIFSRIIAREIPADIVYEDDQVLAFRDIAPQAPTHIVIIPKKPLTNLLDATPDDTLLLGQLFQAAAHVARTLGSGRQRLSGRRQRRTRRRTKRRPSPTCMSWAVVT